MRVLVVLVSLIIFMLWISVMLVVIYPSFDYYFGTIVGFLHWSFMHTLLFMVILSYYRVITTPPGRVPTFWAPPNATQEELDEARTGQKPKENEEGKRVRVIDHSPHSLRYCLKCKQFKPPRAHHCSECDVCIPRMDHHCPWVNNCVGNNNHKLFVVFLVWGVTGIGYGIFLLVLQVYHFIHNIIAEEDVTMTPLKGVIIALNLVVLFPIVLGMVSLLCWQLNLAGLNTTTIEFHEKRWAIREARQKKKPYRWPYDFGVSGNMRLFFGNSKLLWFCPVPPDTLTDGTSYPMSATPELMESLERVDIIDNEDRETHTVDISYAQESNERIRSRDSDRSLMV